ncbi:unnamed protein product [Bursaphelenchus xylophilus]|uniref:(pine wood nematode) hypothetical protein n=1 Tax=Bursaphelenchus xylophilus TaxID=6326 RepID=A0A1I7S504_BURXY|nr:unnamed protein product [Bursaphelenchus xylophilus]CAG9117562.1 unnamed protein product [Bursaphelenchus xylophilus]
MDTIDEASIYKVLLDLVCVLHNVEYVVQLLVTIYCLGVLRRANRLHIHFRSVIAVTVISVAFAHLGRKLCKEIAMIGLPDVLTQNYICCVLSTLHICAITTTIFSICATGLERFIASRSMNTYEEIGHPKTLMVAVVVPSLIFGTVLNYFSTLRYINLEEHPRGQLFIIFDKNIALATLAFFCGLVCTGTGGIIHMLCNRTSVKQFRAGVSLSERFQSREVIVSSSVLTKIAILFLATCSLGLFYSSLRLINFGHTGNGSNLDLLLVELGYIQIDITAPIVLIYFLISHRYLRGIVRKDAIWLLGLKMADRIVKTDETLTIPQTDSYFQHMEDLWSAPHSSRRKASFVPKRVSDSFSTQTVVETIKSQGRKFSVRFVDIL